MAGRKRKPDGPLLGRGQSIQDQLLAWAQEGVAQERAQPMRRSSYRTGPHCNWEDPWSQPHTMWSPPKLNLHADGLACWLPEG